MPDLAPFHPQIVHFVIALFYVGLAVRVVSLTGRMAWTRPAGAALLLLAAAASVFAVLSGDAAHGPAERIPGARDAVEHHEETGERARNFLLAVAGLELIALALSRRERARRALHVVSAAVGLVAGVNLFEAAEHGGEVVYEYGGGVGTRSGDPEHVRRLLIAGLYHQARTAREAGNREEAARLTAELARQAPGDTSVWLLHGESLLQDLGDAGAALDRLRGWNPPDGSRFAVRHGLLLADALRATGQPDSARAVLTDLGRRFPDSAPVREALERQP